MQAALCSLQYNRQTYADRKTNCRPIYLSEINYDGYLIKRKLVMGVYCMWGTSDFISRLSRPFYGCVFFYCYTSVSVFISSLGEVSEMALVEEELPGVSKGESLNVKLAKGCRLPKRACNKS